MYISGWWDTYPSEKYQSQWRLCFYSQLIWKNIVKSCSSHHQPETNIGHRKPVPSTGSPSWSTPMRLTIPERWGIAPRMSSEAIRPARFPGTPGQIEQFANWKDPPSLMEKLTIISMTILYIPFSIAILNYHRVT